MNKVWITKRVLINWESKSYDEMICLTKKEKDAKANFDGQLEDFYHMFEHPTEKDCTKYRLGESQAIFEFDEYRFELSYKEELVF